MRRILGRIAFLLVLLGLGGAAVYAFLPKPVPVDAVRVARGSLRITVEEDGKTRIRETYVVSTPVAGRTSRLEVHPGDRIEAGKTPLVTIEPTAPDLLDERAVARAEAGVRVAQAALEASEAALERARAVERFETERVATREPLIRSGVFSREEYATLLQGARIAQKDVRSAELAVRLAGFAKEQAEAALLYARPAGLEGAPPKRLVVSAPIDGYVLRVFNEDAAIRPSGTRLLEVGDPRDLEVVVDVLTRDAVRIVPGAEVDLVAWGGDAPLAGRVQRVEPAGFTKLSALGVEEQRVLVIVDIETPLADRAGLGHEFRVEARIVVARRDDVLYVPTGAVFRHGEAWAVFRVVEGTARLVEVQPGASAGRSIEVVAGLAEDDLVIAYPSDRVRDGVAVRPR
jgi:HlyD family secretion protein